MKLVYTVWLRNDDMSPEQSDYEWPACFVIEAGSAEGAKDWGDRLAQAHAAARGEELVSSKIEIWSPSTPGLDRRPVVTEGHEPLDAEIGW